MEGGDGLIDILFLVATVRDNDFGTGVEVGFIDDSFVRDEHRE